MFAEAFIDSAAVVPIVTCMMVMVVILEVVSMNLNYYSSNYIILALC